MNGSHIDPVEYTHTHTLTSSQRRHPYIAIQMHALNAHTYMLWMGTTKYSHSIHTCSRAHTHTATSIREKTHKFLHSFLFGIKQNGFYFHSILIAVCGAHQRTANRESDTRKGERTFRIGFGKSPNFHPQFAVAKSKHKKINNKLQRQQRERERHGHRARQANGVAATKTTIQTYIAAHI